MRTTSTRRKRVLLFAASMAAAFCCWAGDKNGASGWPDWDRFAQRFVQGDGRVIDLTFDGKSTSEGQSYGLFFALVANEPKEFDTILKWTSDNLADGQLGEKLPGWLWGKRDDGSWGIKDRNAAADADLWLAYTLLEAGRLWHAPEHEARGRKLLRLVGDHDVVRAGSSGTVLLPGPYGFALDHNRFRINPSYVPGFMFVYFSNVDRGGPWKGVWDSYVRLAPKMFGGGVAPDIVVVNNKGAVTQDTERAPAGSYDAIRVYLWAGMSGENSESLLRLLAPYAKFVRDSGKPPEAVNPANGKIMKADYSPIGYVGALLPFAKALRDEESLHALRNVLAAHEHEAKAGKPTNYYDEALILFGKGWDEGFYRFDAQGRLETKWNRE